MEFGRRRRRATLISIALIMLVLSPLLAGLLKISSLQAGSRTNKNEIASKRMAIAVTTSITDAGFRRTEIRNTAIDVCFNIERSLASLVPYTVTRCLPSFQSNRISFMISSATPIFSVWGAKKAWFIGIVGVIGQALNDHPNLPIDQIYVSDSALLANKHQLFAFPAMLAKDLQRRAKDYEISREGLYFEVIRALRALHQSEKLVHHAT
jgi:hypothetical protein